MMILLYIYVHYPRFFLKCIGMYERVFTSFKQNLLLVMHITQLNIFINCH